MSDTPNPFVRLGDDGEQAPRLRYSVPESTSFAGTSVTMVDVPEHMLNQATLEALRANRQQRQPPRPLGGLTRVGSLVATAANVTPISTRASFVTEPAGVAPIYQESGSSLFYMPREEILGFGGGFDVIVPKPEPPEKISPKILFFEKLQLSTFLGDYGAGRIIKTFSLFPGEKTKISMRSYQKTVETETQKLNYGSSILDSVTEEAAVDFENSIQTEQSHKYEESEANILNSMKAYSKSSGEGSGSVLWGLAKGGGKSSSESGFEMAGEWGSRSAREETAKVVTSALAKHSSRASSKRDIEINTSSEVSTETSTEEMEETAIERVIENLNVSRTLNLAFRQMLQEFVSVLHLVGVEIALYDETAGPYPKYSIRELDDFLDEYFADDEEVRDAIRDGIIEELACVFNYRDEAKPFLERVTLECSTDLTGGGRGPRAEPIEYLRVRKDLTEKLAEDDTIEVPGVILSANRITMRTDGVVVDAFLGEGEALDAYQRDRQSELVRQLQLGNSLHHQEVLKAETARAIIDAKDETGADIFEKVFPCCPPPESKAKDSKE